MEDNRKLAVAFGNFACVVEGYEDPFQVMKRVVRFFENQAANNPEFGDFNADGQVEKLRTRLEDLYGDGTLDISWRDGGLHVRRLSVEETGVTALPEDAQIVDAQEGAQEEERPNPFADEASESEAAQVEGVGVDEAQTAEDPAPHEDAVGEETLDRQADTETGDAEEADTEDADTQSAVNDAADNDLMARLAAYQPSEPEVDTADEAEADEPQDDPEAPEFEAYLAARLASYAADAATSEQPADAPDPQEEEIPDVEEVAAETTSESDRPEGSLHGGLHDTPADDPNELIADAEDDKDPAQEPIFSPHRVEAVEDDEPEAEVELTSVFGSTEALEPEDEPEPMVADAEEPMVAETEDDPPLDQEADVDDDADADADVDEQTAAEDADTGPLLRFSGTGPRDKPAESRSDPLRLTPDDAPLRLGPSSEVGSAEKPTDPLPLTPAMAPPRPLFRRKDDAGDIAAEDAPAAKPAGLGTLRLGEDRKVPPPNTDDGPSFIDSITPPEPARPKPAPVPDPEVDDEISRTLSDTLDTDTPPAPAASGKGLRLGGFLRKRTAPEPQDDAADADAAESAPRLVLSDAPSPEVDDAAATASKPTMSGRLRVVTPEDEQAALEAAEQAETAAAKPARGGLRSFLRGGKQPSPEAEAPVAEETPAPPPAPEAETQEDVPPPKPQVDEANDPVRDRLHASFADEPVSMASRAIDLDEADDEEVDTLSPLGFARRAEASSLPELMKVAAGYLNIVEGKSAVTRAELLGVVEEIASNTPLTAEAKVKAVGKLVRSGELVRLEGGMFMLDDKQLQTFQAQLDGAA